jgi:formamidopyrimidine-DNA glycosylase
MPELPETETMARDLDATLRGAVIASVETLQPDVLRGCTADALPVHVIQHRIIRVWRRAKFVILDLAPADSSRDAPTAHLVVQPRFTGAVLFEDDALPVAMRGYVCLRFTMSDGRRVVYRDVRRLGTVAYLSPDALTQHMCALGPEPLDASLGVSEMQHALGRSVRPIKSALMDQTKLAGVGNIYATEALWLAGIDPSKSACDLTVAQWQALHTQLRRILAESIRVRGTSFRDYRDARGEKGGFVSALGAYGRGGEPCRQCGRRLISTHAIDGRSTVFCATCQR